MKASEPQFGFTGALDSDCSHGGRNANGVEVFLAACSRTAVSPDGQWRLVNGADTASDRAAATEASAAGDYVFIDNGAGRRIGPVPGLSDGMPFAVIWSPRPGWFFVDHHAGSFMQVPEVFEISPDGVIRHDALVDGRAIAREHLPCLPDDYEDWAFGNVMGWSRDGSRLAWALKTRIDVCMDPDQGGAVRSDQSVQPLVMVSDIASGRVIEASVIVLDDDKAEDFTLPESGPYQDIARPD